MTRPLGYDHNRQDPRLVLVMPDTAFTREPDTHYIFMPHEAHKMKVNAAGASAHAHGWVEMTFYRRDGSEIETVRVDRVGPLRT